MAFTVTRRTAELGLRMALGAPRRHVLSLVMREVLLLVGIGTAVALPIALGIGHYLKNQLFQIRPNDPPTLLGAMGVLLIVALLAGYIPAFRATRIDPVTALCWD